MNRNDPWANSVELAKADVRRAEFGDAQAAGEVLRQASVALREVLAGRLLDPERREYVGFLLRALERLDAGAPADKALGVFTSTRPRTVSQDRDFKLFLAVGLRWEKLQSVDKAIEAVADKYGFGVDVVRKAWSEHGATAVWRQATREE